MSADLDSVRDLMGQAEDVDMPEEMGFPEDDADYGMDPHDPGAAPGGDCPDGGGTEGGGPEDEGPDPETVRRAAALPQNDHGNGQRFVLYYGDDVIWVPVAG